MLAQLLQLKEVAGQGFYYTQKKYVVIPIEERFQISHIQSLLKYPAEVLDQLASLTPPELVRNFAAGKIQGERRQAVQEFETALMDDKKDEKFWQDFFSKHTWIFGYGLNYVFLHLLKVQPSLKGSGLDGKGSQRGDYLLHTLGSKFTVIVEIKTPTTRLLQLYRNKEEYAVSQELVGGVSQVQSYCRNWEKEAQDATKNRPLINDQIETIDPKGILIIGDTAELDSLEKKERFQLFRRNLKDPEIITFNELLARANYLANSPV